MAGATTIMTETLPTVIGMGTVTRATDTMFGKKGQRRTTTRRAKSQLGSRKIHTGKRGGKYIMKKGRRVYI